MKNVNRIVMTLDAGGTNLVFSAICDGEEIVEPITLRSEVNNLNGCLQVLLKGFTQVKEALKEEPVAISFAFPGPADYEAGIIGDLPNFPSFRGGVALGPFLNKHFGIPVYINNDGSLFAYGEALAGSLPELNQKLKEAGSCKQYHNLLGITLGTGFGAGVVINNNELLIGDNGCGGDVWCCRNKKYPEYIVEESVSIRAVKRVYAELSGDKTDLTPKDIFDIAEGKREGNKQAAVSSFEELGEMAGEAIASAVTLLDGVVAIGGGLSGASKYFMPALMRELNGTLAMMNGNRFNRLQMKAFNLEDPEELQEFLKGGATKVQIPGTDEWVDYDPCKRIGVMISKQGANRSIALGAYQYALAQMDK